MSREQAQECATVSLCFCFTPKSCKSKDRPPWQGILGHKCVTQMKWVVCSSLRLTQLWVIWITSRPSVSRVSAGQIAPPDCLPAQDWWATNCCKRTLIPWNSSEFHISHRLYLELATENICKGSKLCSTQLAPWHLCFPRSSISGLLI